MRRRISAGSLSSALLWTFLARDSSYLDSVIWAGII